MTPWENVIYHWGPPAVGGALTMIVGFIVRNAEKKRMKDEEEARKFRADIKQRITTIRQQNGWFIRKFIELTAQHNLKHTDAHLDVGDYPNGYKDSGD